MPCAGQRHIEQPSLLRIGKCHQLRRNKPQDRIVSQRGRERITSDTLESVEYHHVVLKALGTVDRAESHAHVGSNASDDVETALILDLLVPAQYHKRASTGADHLADW